MIDQFKIDSYGCRVWCSIMNQRWLRVKSLVSWASCSECLLFKRLRDMVLVSGQNEVLLVLLSFFDVGKQCLFQEQ